MELVKSVVHFELDQSGNVVAGNIARTYSVTDASGTYQRSVMDVLSASDLASLLPDQGSLILQLQTANTEKAEAVSKMNEMEAARDAAIRERDEVIERHKPKEVGGFTVLSPVQMRRGLRSLGVLPEHVQAAIDQIPDEAARADAHDQWEYALGFERSNPLIATLGMALGLKDEDIDAAWRAASQ